MNDLSWLLFGIDYLMTIVNIGLVIFVIDIKENEGVKI